MIDTIYFLLCAFACWVITSQEGALYRIVAAFVGFAGGFIGVIAVIAVELAAGALGGLIDERGKE